ncbi:alkaline phosphatase synthesis sensor protein phoR [Clostridium putrefaciens]|uniref:histidine kinase n=1 Tax=Clostridium putrefaciens TaxID=99675 RepID=A0A381J9H7_9CLOT|nr:HAMP domain-containing sensor histidine kinase [Clostridium putrefaciens]SUY47910.1 alkaline phosphatase synthesis sensor protein phoR [Clostridium putrefaciens]
MKRIFKGDQSIRVRLILKLLIIILFTISILEVSLITFVGQYFYKNTEDIITNQVMVSADLYNSYFSNSTLEDNILDNVDVFWKQTNAQVQILNTDGKLIMDSLGATSEEYIKSVDVKKAIGGEKGKWVGNVNYYDHKVMAVSYPLKSYDETVGVIRFISSMEDVESSIYSISLVFIVIGSAVLIISGIVTWFAAKNIIYPVRALTITAEKMAEGNYYIRNTKVKDDEIGKLSDTLNYMAEEILKKDKLKNEFISSVSHELRTPLTSIKGWTVTLGYDLEDKEVIKDGLSIIEKECDRLTEMVEELLDFSKFVSGKVSLQKVSIDIIDIISYIDRYMSPRAQREHIDLLVSVEDNIPKVYLDVNRMKQVFINLLDNALKFTPKEGKVTIKAYAKADELNVVIIDTGSGISKKDLPRIKEKFYKGKSSKSQNGIGLSICDEIIKLHEGKFIIESEEGNGTVVKVILPLKDKISIGI